MKNQKLVISVGGSLLVPKLPPQAENFKKYANFLMDLSFHGHYVLAVCGGGELARDYQRKLAPRDFHGRDLAGIKATKENAMKLCRYLGNFGTKVILDYRSVPRYYGKKIVCVGGNKPGHSTDWDAAFFAQRLSADLIINATNVDGIYSCDPKKSKLAELIPDITYDTYLKQFGSAWEPGMHAPFDYKAASLMVNSKHRIPTVIVNGTNLENILAAIEGKKVGTLLY